MENKNSVIKDTGVLEKDEKIESDQIEPSDLSEFNLMAFVKNMVKNITVEPVLACYIMPSVLAMLAIQNMNLEKACRVNQGYGDDICDKLINQDVQNLTEEVQIVQSLVANMSAWKSPLLTSIPALMIIFIGAWSDRTGRRKPCMLMPLIGEFLTSAGLILCTIYFLEWPMEVAGVIEALPPAMSGGWTTMFMSVFSHISDHTTIKNRTFRIGMVNIFHTGGIAIGNALSGILTKKLGFYGVFSISMTIYVIGFVYAFFFIKDKQIIQETKKGGNVCVGFFNLRYVTDTLMVAFKPRTGNRRLRVILLLCIFILITGPIYGEMGITYLFSRYKFKFTEVDFSIYSTYMVIMSSIGTLLCMSVFSRYLEMDDTLIGALAGLSKIAASFVFAFAPTVGWLYLGPIIDCFNGTGIIVMRSIATKLVEPTEIGRINSLFGVVEAIVPIIYSPIYSHVYVRTIDTFPGAFFIIGAILTVPAVLVFIFMFTLQRKDCETEKGLNEKERITNKEKFAYDNEITKF